MQNLYLFLIIGLTFALIKDSNILAAAISSDKQAEDIESGKDQENSSVNNYIVRLNELLNCEYSPEIDQKIKNELSSFFYSDNLRDNKVIIQFFRRNKQKLLKFVDGDFISALICTNNLKLLKIFLNRDNVNTTIKWFWPAKTIFIYAIEILNPIFVELIIKNGADVNEIINNRPREDTPLGVLICREIEIRDKHANEPDVLEENLKKIRETAKILFDAGADITLGRLKKSDFNRKYFKIKIDIRLIDLQDQPKCRTVFEEYENYKTRASKEMMNVGEIAMFPPGLLPLCLSYL